MKYLKTYKLFENPNHIYKNIKGEWIDLSFEDDDAIPFFYDIELNTIFLGQSKIDGIYYIHPELIQIVNKHRSQKGYAPLSIYDTNLLYSGRIWKGRKVISFWSYPDKEMFDIIINKLEDKSSVRIWGNDWLIEVVIGDDNISIKNLPYNWKDNNAMEKGIIKMVPVDEYDKSENFDREDHIKSPLNKSKKPTYYKTSKHKPKNITNIEYKGMMKNIYQESILSFGEYIKETPDYIYNRNTEWEMEWSDDDARPFQYLTNDLFSGEKSGEFHLGNYGDNHPDMFPSGGLYSGRIWDDPSKQIISFWDYPPNKEEFKKIIDQLERKTGHKIWNKDWKIEVLVDKNINRWDIEAGDDMTSDLESIIIPVVDYTGSEDTPKELLNMHLKDKSKLKVPTGFGSKHKHKYQTNLEPIRYKNMMKNVFTENVDTKPKRKKKKVIYEAIINDIKGNIISYITNFKMTKLEEKWMTCNVKGYKKKKVEGYKTKVWVYFEDKLKLNTKCFKNGKIELLVIDDK